jgi:hypothetical protein
MRFFKEIGEVFSKASGITLLKLLQRITNCRLDSRKRNPFGNEVLPETNGLKFRSCLRRKGSLRIPARAASTYIAAASVALTYSFPPEVLGSPTRSVLFLDWGIGYHRTGPVTRRLMPSVDVPAVVNERVGEVPIAELLARRQFSIELKGVRFVSNLC